MSRALVMLLSRLWLASANTGQECQEPECPTIANIVTIQSGARGASMITDNDAGDDTFGVPVKTSSLMQATVQTSKTKLTTGLNSSVEIEPADPGDPPNIKCCTQGYYCNMCNRMIVDGQVTSQKTWIDQMGDNRLGKGCRARNNRCEVPEIKYAQPVVWRLCVDYRTDICHTRRRRKTPNPTVTPTTPEPTVQPTAEPTLEPTAQPTAQPTVEPTAQPTAEPTWTCCGVNAMAIEQLREQLVSSNKQIETLRNETTILRAAAIEKLREQLVSSNNQIETLRNETTIVREQLVSSNKQIEILRNETTILRAELKRVAPCAFASNDNGNVLEQIDDLRAQIAALK